MSKKITNNRRVMETGDHFKNGASPKSQMNKRNFLKRFALLLIGLIVFGLQVWAQNAKPMQILNVGAMPEGDVYSYMQTSMYFAESPNVYMIFFDTQVIVPTKVKYSLYTYKKTFPQDGKRNWLQGIRECSCVNPLTTQDDIDKALDKIYEFPTVTESKSGRREWFWDTYSDPKFTNGQKYAIRDCIYVAAHNADTGELIDILNTGAPELYRIYSRPAILYRLDLHKDGNEKSVKETLSGTVNLAYDDTRPIKKITALIMVENCGFGAVSYETANQGAEAIAADINKRIPGDVIAYTTLTNPTINPGNKFIHTFDWKDIKTVDGKDFIPDIDEYYMGFRLAIIIETDEMTYTGLKNGYIYDGDYSIPPVPRGVITANEEIEKSEIKIISDENGFVVLCPAGVLAKSYAVYDMVGRTLKTGSLSGLPRETITAPELRSGVYFVHLQVNENGKDQTVTKKVVR